MTDKFIMNAVVSYRDVDRTEVLQLPAVFKFLQEAAIRHANEFDTGTRAMVTRQESWVLNRMAATVHRYPRYEEMLRIETWSRGVKGFKGHREFRVFGEANEPLCSASSLWLYVSLKTKSIVRVPADVAAGFPARAEGPFCPELESLTFDFPPDAAVQSVAISLRFGDIDINAHVNNTVYLDYVQTALAQSGRPVRPTDIRIKYAKAIPAEATAVKVRLASFETTTRFSIEAGDTVFAQGEVG